MKTTADPDKVFILFGRGAHDTRQDGDFAFTAVFTALAVSLWRGKGDLVPWAGAALLAILSEKLPDTGRFKEFMEALPGTILVSLVAPGVLAAGLWGCLASLATALLVWRTGNVFVAMFSGMGIVAGARHLGL